MMQNSRGMQVRQEDVLQGVHRGSQMGRVRVVPDCMWRQLRVVCAHCLWDVASCRASLLHEREKEKREVTVLLMLQPSWRQLLAKSAEKVTLPQTICLENNFKLKFVIFNFISFAPRIARSTLLVILFEV